MTCEIFSALNVLTTPVSEARDAQSTQQEALLAALSANRSLLLEQLLKGQEVVRRLRGEVLAGLEWFSDTGDVTWDFVQECLLLLLTLARHLSSELDRFNQTAIRPADKLRTPEVAPPLPPDVLSVTQQKTVAAALQFVVSLGVCPYLAPGVGVPLGHRSAFGAMVEKVVQGGGVASATRRLWTTTTALLEIAELSSLATLVFTRHLGDVMAALSQLGHQPHREDGVKTGDSKQTLPAEERLRCRESLQSLLGKVYQPVVVKELLILQGGPRQARPARGSSSRAALGSAPAWLRRLCGQLLSERLIQPSGVQAVVRAVLEGGAGSESDWRKCDGVAKVLVACPQQSESANSYYQRVCPQILDLLHFRDKLTALQFQRVATRAVLSMVQEKPGFAQRNLLKPLLAPLSRCTTVAGAGDCVEEHELTGCVEDVYKIWVVGNAPSSLLLSALEEVIPVVFTLFSFTQKSRSHLRGPCEEILLWYLRQADSSAALVTLKRLSGLQEQKNRVSAGFHFTAGSDGGARLIHADACGDEDDVLFERVSAEQWRLECLMQLLAQLTDRDLPGDFFLDLLQELTSVASATAADEDEQQVDVSVMSLLEVEEKMLVGSEQLGHRLVLLQVLAVMVETVQHTVLLRRHTQVVGFMETLLQRACVGLDQNHSQTPANPIESQTLSMGMGLVATLLSGPQGPDRASWEEGGKSRSDYFSSMSSLLAPLLTLSEKHPDVFIQELASNLRAIIASHGVCRPESFSSTTSRSSAESEARRSREPELEKKQQQTQTRGDTHTVPAAGKSSELTGPPTRTFSDCVMEACDPDVPTRAVALRVLTGMLQNTEPQAVKEKEKLLVLFLENLEHEDSFVYLSAVQGLAVLADCFPEKILDRLLTGFQHSPGPSCRTVHSVESRLKMGEVLMRASRAMGELAPHLGRPLVSVFLRGTRDSDQSIRASSLSNLGELCQRLDYALVPLAQELSSCLTALIKTEKEVEVRRAAVHVITVLLRGLADKTTQVLGRRSRVKIRPGVKSRLTTSESPAPSAVPTWSDLFCCQEGPAAGPGLSLVEQNLQLDLTNDTPAQVLTDVLLDLYRALKLVVRCDPDPVSVLHAQLALEELDLVMRRFIFPQQKLEKKIVVLP